jgi:hypothetical protein
MKIERTNNELIIRLSDKADPDGVQRLINFLRYQEATTGSKAKQKAVDALASEVNKSWWEENKDRFLNS